MKTAKEASAEKVALPEPLQDIVYAISVRISFPIMQVKFAGAAYETAPVFYTSCAVFTLNCM